MKHADFKIGTEFRTKAGYWRYTDLGTRVVVAIKLDLDHDPTWYDGPPYAVAEHVFDEDDLEGCEPVLNERPYDDRGRTGIVSVEFPDRRCLIRNGAHGIKQPRRRPRAGEDP